MNNKKDNNLEKELMSIKDYDSNNYLLENIDNFNYSEFFKEIDLINKQVLFDEWDFDNNFYIVKKWHLSIEKYTTKDKKSTKQLAILKRWDFLWEWSFLKSEAKQNKVLAIWKTKLLVINGKEWLRRYLKSNIDEWLELLLHIVNISNLRLLQSNSQITANYEINLAISNLTEINLISIFSLFDKFSNIIYCDYLLYFENHQTMNDIVILKYDSRENNKMQDKIFKKENNKLIIRNIYKEINISLDDSIILNELKIWTDTLWYILIWRVNNEFSLNEKKMISSISNSLTWVLKQYLLNKENSYKELWDSYIEEL